MTITFYFNFSFDLYIKLQSKLPVPRIVYLNSVYFSYQIDITEIGTPEAVYRFSCSW